MSPYIKGQWIRISHLGALEIVGCNDRGVIVAHDPAGMGRRIVDWDIVRKQNPRGSVPASEIRDSEIV